jgi:hypothetical protein
MIGSVEAIAPSVERDDRAPRRALLGYLGFLAAVLIAIGVQNLRERSDWAMGDWLINYSGGFVRRGLIGAAALGVARVGISPYLLVLVLQLALYGAIAYAVLRLAEGLPWNVWTLALVYSPATLAFAVHDPSFGFRKEILYFALLGQTLLLLRRGAWKDGPLAVLLTVGMTVCVLSHEALAVLFPYLFCALLLGFGSVMRAARVAALPALATVAGFAVASRFPGNAAVSRAVCSSLGGDAATCGGAIEYLGRTPAYARAKVMELASSIPYIRHFALVTVLAFVPVAALIWILWRDRRQRFAATSLTACAGASILASVPLFVYGTDWTRWVHLHVFSLFLLLLFVLPQTALERKRPLAYTAWALLLVYTLSWNLSMYQPRIPFGGLVHYVMHHQRAVAQS